MLLRILNNRVQVTVHALLNPHIKAVWDRDTHERKSEAIKELSYIAYYLDPYKSNPYREYSGVEVEDEFGFMAKTVRHVKILATIFPDSPEWEMDEVLQKAFTSYKDILKTASRSFTLLDGLEAALDKLNIFYLDQLDFTATTNSGNSKYKPADIQTGIKGAVEMSNNLGKMREKVLDEITEHLKTKADAEIGIFENPAQEDLTDSKKKYGT